MGKGAYVQIQNLSGVQVTVTYTDIACMFQSGSEGSDFGPISGTAAPGASLPAAGTQYIEAIASSLCASQKSTFTMNIQGPSGTLTLGFVESGNSYSVDPTYLVQAGLGVATAIQSGDQYQIQVVIRTQTWATATWMADLGPTLGPRTLASVALPGTHDSGSYDIKAGSTVPPGQDLPQWVNAIYGLWPWGLVAAAVIAGWSKTQPSDIGTQLQAGIRYFDLRVVLNGSEYFFCHTLQSAPVDDAIAELSSFLALNPKEVVILDFNHLYAMPDAPSLSGLVDKLTAAFGSKMAPNALGPTATIQTFWDAGYQVVALFADEATVAQYPQLWPQTAIRSPWPDTTDTTVLQDTLDSALSARSADQLFVLQGILTPDATMIANGGVVGHPGSIASLAATVTPLVLGWAQAWAARDINIVIVDWYTVSPSYVDEIVALNLERDPPA